MRAQASMIRDADRVGRAQPSLETAKGRFDARAFEQMLRRRHDQGTSIADLCRGAKISKQTFYSWRKRYQRLRIEQLIRDRKAEESQRNLRALLKGLSLRPRT